MNHPLFILFLTIFGMCVGSFINVIIYRLPKGISIVSPPSFCPNCKTPIRWFDNIPIISYLILLGRCRTCKTPISPRYTIIELTTALLFVAFYDATYISHYHSWFSNIQSDWPIFISHLALLSTLLIASAMDIEYYLIDIRIIFPLYLIGPIAFALLPANKISYICSLPFAPSSLLLATSLTLTYLLLFFLYPRQAKPPEDEIIEFPDQPISPPTLSSILSLFIYLLIGLSLIVSSAIGSQSTFPNRALAYFIIIFLAIIVSLIPKRISDKIIENIIETNSTSARKNAIKELINLLIPTLIFIIGYTLPLIISPIHSVLNTIANIPQIKAITFALYSLFISAFFGWLIRISFSLIFGKEAMGVGDIYILSVIGTVAGPFVPILGFFIGSVIGVFGIAFLILWKTYRTLSYVPWISIGTFICLLFYNPIINYIKPIIVLFRLQ